MKSKTHIRLNGRIKLIHGDCLDLLANTPDESVDLTVTSPPYCMGKEYEESSDVHNFVAAHQKILPEIVRVTKEGGSFCWQVGYHIRKGAGIAIPLDYLVYQVLAEQPRVHLRNRIIWTFGHGMHNTNRFSGRHEVILWFTKGNSKKFDLDAVRIPQKYPGKKYYRGPNKGKLSGNPMGKNPGDVWEIPNVKSKHPEKTSHPCQFPVGLARRLVAALTTPDDLVLDPYTGSGSTGVAAILLNRRFVGAEINGQYCKIALKRFDEAVGGNAKVRDFESPVLTPPEGRAVTRRPEHFRSHDPHLT